MGRLAVVRTAFTERFWRPVDRVARAPGRVNLIGEHTDYNAGFVLPMAIERDVLVAFNRRPDRQVVLHSADFDEDAAFSLDGIQRDEEHTWSNYPRGVARELQESGVRLLGMDAVIQGNVPIGAGLSSSAAFEVAMALAFLAAADEQMDRVQVALIAQRAENRFVGMQCGIMDQFVSSLGQAGHVLLIDCRDLSHRAVPMPDGARVVVCDTMTRRGLVTSAYNERRRQCEEAVRILSGALPHVQALRDVTPENLEHHSELLPPVVRRRAAHVVSENARVLQAVAALEGGEPERFGQLMDASHASLRDDYEVSSRELNIMVEQARCVPGCLGARMTGAGFGGVTVNLVRDEAVASFVESVAAGYEAETGLEPEITVSKAAPGAGILA
jgi:galactokinase